MMKLVIIFCVVAPAFSGIPRLGLRSRLDARIMGGYSTTIEEHPYQVSLQYSGTHICGGSIITATWILTAAHCNMFDNYSVRAGSSIRGSGGTVYSVKNIIMHPLFHPGTHDYDFALYQIVGYFYLDASQEMIPVPSQGESISAGTIAVVTGWGTTSEGGPQATVLQKVDVPIVSDISCNTSYSGGITERMVCAGFDAGGRDACQGDVGGPLVAKGKLIGVVSWGNGCGRAKYPGVYARVASVRDWIKANTGL